MSPSRESVGLRALQLRRRPAQRERERERRVSDADASNYTRVNSTRTLQHVDPQRLHAKTTPSQKTDPVPLPRALLKPVSVDHRDQPNPTYVDRHPTTGQPDIGELYTSLPLLSTAYYAPFPYRYVNWRALPRHALSGDGRVYCLAAWCERPGVGLALGVSFAVVLDQLAAVKAPE
jgi:hypothetical protein